MFPYRRQGPKKRNKDGHNRRPRGPHKPLPNSARELLPLLQPATKALAQVLAGRASSSGQFGHAQAVAAQADRLIADRAHNRLNPAEREEFFEQLARLKLTLTDAEAEAGVQAEQEEVRAAPRPPVAQERLKQMALALTRPDRGPNDPAANGEGAGEPVGLLSVAAPARAVATQAEAPEAERPAAEATAEPRSVANAQSGRLQLSRTAAERAASAVATAPRTRASGARRSARTLAGAPRQAPADAAEEPSEQAGLRPTPQDTGTAASPETGVGEAEPGNQNAVRPPRKIKQKGLPEGWVIDEEGYVVPGP